MTQELPYKSRTLIVIQLAFVLLFLGYTGIHLYKSRTQRRIRRRPIIVPLSYHLPSHKADILRGSPVVNRSEYPDYPTRGASNRHVEPKQQHSYASVPTSGKDLSALWNRIVFSSSSASQQRRERWCNPPFLNQTVEQSIRKEIEALQTIVVRKDELTTNSPRSSRILCVIFETSPGLVHAIRDTWGSDCDGFVSIKGIGIDNIRVDPSQTALLDSLSGSVPVFHVGATNQPQAFDNAWQLFRSMLAYIYEEHYANYDWFHVGNDHHFVIVDHLRAYLNSDEIAAASIVDIPANTTIDFQLPLFLGSPVTWEDTVDNHVAKDSLYSNGYIYNSQAAGITFNQAFLRTFSLKATFDHFRCEPWAVSNRPTFDELLAECMYYYGVVPYNTTDDAHGQHRYYPFSPFAHLNDFQQNGIDNGDTYKKLETYTGVASGISAKSISFGSINHPGMMYALYDTVSATSVQRAGIC